MRFMDTHGDKYWEATYGKVLAERAAHAEAQRR